MRSRPQLDRLRWRKSSYSGGTGGECVELAGVPGYVLFRDSKDPGGPVICLDLACSSLYEPRVSGVPELGALVALVLGRGHLMMMLSLGAALSSVQPSWRPWTASVCPRSGLR